MHFGPARSCIALLARLGLQERNGLGVHAQPVTRRIEVVDLDAHALQRLPGPGPQSRDVAAGRDRAGRTLRHRLPGDDIDVLAFGRDGRHPGHMGPTPWI